MKNLFENKMVLTGVLLLTTYIFTNLLFSVIYEDGDDVFMQMIVQGSASGQPDVHLVFINVIVGYLLKPFYQLNNTIYWYSSLMVFLQFASLFVILHHFIREKLRWYAILAILIFFQYFIIRLQFTTISGLLSIAGMLLLQQAFDENRVRLYVISFFFLLFSIWLRFEMFLLTTAICGLFFFIQNRIRLMDFKSNKGMILFSLLFIGSALLSKSFNDSHYSSGEWQYYKEFNLVRGKVNDNSNLIRYTDKIKQVDKKEYDELRLVGLFLYPESYDVKKFQSVRESMKPDLMQTVSNVISVVRSFYVFSGILFLLIINALLLYKKKYMLLLPGLLFFLLILYIAREGTLKPRLLYPIILIFMVYTVSLFRERFGIALSILLILITVSGNARYLNYRAEAIAMPSLPRDKYIITLSTVPFSYHPFKLNHINSFQNIIYRGWCINLPTTLEKLRRDGIPVNQNLALLDDELLNENALYFCDKYHIPINKYLATKNKKLIATQQKNLYKIITNDTIQQTASDR